MELLRFIIYVGIAFALTSTAENYIPEKLTWRGRLVMMGILLGLGYGLWALYEWCFN